MCESSPAGDHAGSIGMSDRSPSRTTAPVASMVSSGHPWQPVTAPLQRAEAILIAPDRRPQFGLALDLGQAHGPHALGLSHLPSIPEVSCAAVFGRRDSEELPAASHSTQLSPSCNQPRTWAQSGNLDSRAIKQRRPNYERNLNRTSIHWGESSDQSLAGACWCRWMWADVDCRSGGGRRMEKT